MPLLRLSKALFPIRISICLPISPDFWKLHGEYWRNHLLTIPLRCLGNKAYCVKFVGGLQMKMKASEFFLLISLDWDVEQSLQCYAFREPLCCWLVDAEQKPVARLFESNKGYPIGGCTNEVARNVDKSGSRKEGLSAPLQSSQFRGKKIQYSIVVCESHFSAQIMLGVI